MPEAQGEIRQRLDWLDQLAFELFRATGRSQLMQCLWLYDRPVDFDALRGTKERLEALAFNRLIEPSVLPWGRPCWVRPPEAGEPLARGGTVLPRGALLGWANRQARLPIDPVTGPAWRMSVQSFDDGSTAVSVVGSHLVIDGMGALHAIEAAATGQAVPSAYPRRGSRGVLAGCLADGWQSLIDAPRTVAALGRILGARTGAQAGGGKAPPSAQPSGVVELAAVALSVEAGDWEGCARRLGGPVNALLPAFVARLAANLGRVNRNDGTVSLLVPVDRREGLADRRALAIEFRSMTLAPEGLAQGLRPVVGPLKALLRGPKEAGPDSFAAVLPAIAWMPRAAATALVNRLFAYSDALPVSCSNLGTMPVGLARIDGADCARVLARAVDVNVSRHDLERSHGHLVVVASRHGGLMSLCIEACQLEPAPTSPAALRSVTERTLAEFGLAAQMEV